MDSCRIGRYSAIAWSITPTSELLAYCLPRVKHTHTMYGQRGKRMLLHCGWYISQGCQQTVHVVWSSCLDFRQTAPLYFPKSIPWPSRDAFAGRQILRILRTMWFSIVGKTVHTSETRLKQNLNKTVSNQFGNSFEIVLFSFVSVSFKLCGSWTCRPYNSMCDLKSDVAVWSVWKRSSVSIYNPPSCMWRPLGALKRTAATISWSEWEGGNGEGNKVIYKEKGKTEGDGKELINRI